MSHSKPVNPNSQKNKPKMTKKQKEAAEAEAAAERDASAEFHTRTWDVAADASSPMQLEALWEYELRKNVKDPAFQEHYRVIRFFLKVLYRIVTSAYNYGLAQYKYLEFKLPEGHFEQWKKQSLESRQKLFLELRFCHATGVGEESGGANCINSFLVTCDVRTMDMLGGLDNKFVARHGVQVPVSEIKYRGATDEETLVYMNTRIEMDQKLLDVIDKGDENFKDGLEEMIEEAKKLKKHLEKTVAEKKSGENTAATASTAAPAPPATPAVEPHSKETFEALGKQFHEMANKNLL